MGMPVRWDDDAKCKDPRLRKQIEEWFGKHGKDTIDKKNVQGGVGLRCVCKVAEKDYKIYQPLWGKYWGVHASTLRWWRLDDCTEVLGRLDEYENQRVGPDATEIERTDVFAKRRGVFAPVAKPKHVGAGFISAADLMAQPQGELIGACQEWARQNAPQSGAMLG
jgi:hypothetical protein